LPGPLQNPGVPPSIGQPFHRRASYKQRFFPGNFDALFKVVVPIGRWIVMKRQ